MSNKANRAVALLFIVIVHSKGRICFLSFDIIDRGNVLRVSPSQQRSLVALSTHNRFAKTVVRRVI